MCRTRSFDDVTMGTSYILGVRLCDGAPVCVRHPSALLTLRLFWVINSIAGSAGLWTLREAGGPSGCRGWTNLPVMRQLDVDCWMKRLLVDGSGCVRALSVEA